MFNQKINWLVVCVLFFFVSVDVVNAQADVQSFEPRCLSEKLALKILDGHLQNYRSGSIQLPPGKRILANFQLEDKKFAGSKGADPNWEKWADVVRSYTDTDRLGRATELVVSIHYMVNLKTRETDQIKFTSSYEQGCVGKKIVLRSAANNSSGTNIFTDAQFEVRGHWEWWDDYSNGQYVGSRDYKFIIDQAIIYSSSITVATKGKTQ